MTLRCKNPVFNRVLETFTRFDEKSENISYYFEFPHFFGAKHMKLLCRKGYPGLDFETDGIVLYV